MIGICGLCFDISLAVNPVLVGAIIAFTSISSDASFTIIDMLSDTLSLCSISDFFRW